MKIITFCFATFILIAFHQLAAQDVDLVVMKPRQKPDGIFIANSAMVVKNIEELEWHPKNSLPPGAFLSVVIGDPAKGHYAFYGKFPARYTVPAHWHSFDCTVLIVKGDMTVKREGLEDVTINQGGFFTLPAKMIYSVFTGVECIFLVQGEDPFDIIYFRTSDDPRNK